MPKIDEAYVEIKADVTKLKAQLNNLGKDVKTEGAKIGKSFGSAFGSVLGFVGIAGAVMGLVGVLKQAVAAARENAIAQAKVAQAVKTTGMSAGFTAKELIRMASGLQELTAVDDDEILKGITNNLLTFKNVAGESFKRAQLAILDLNAVIAGGEVGALTSQTIQLGKALNDPIQGISALTRVGISFTTVQKEHIKNLVNQGKLYEAQSLMLTEIEGQYGGQAKALADATGGAKQFSATWGDFLERVGKPIVGVLGKILYGLTKMLTPQKDVNVNFNETKETTRELSNNFNILTSRYLQLSGVTNKTDEQQKIYNETIKSLNTQYPNYLKNVNLYTDSVNKVKVAFDEARKSLDAYIESLIAAAIMKDREAEIVEIGKALYDAEKSLMDTKTALIEFNKTGIDPLSGLKVEGGNFADVVRMRLSSGIILLENNIKKIQGQKDVLKQTIQGLQDTFKTALAPAPIAPIITPKRELTEEELKKAKDLAERIAKERLDAERVYQTATAELRRAAIEDDYNREVAAIEDKRRLAIEFVKEKIKTEKLDEQAAALEIKAIKLTADAELAMALRERRKKREEQELEEIKERQRLIAEIMKDVNLGLDKEIDERLEDSRAIAEQWGGTLSSVFMSVVSGVQTVGQAFVGLLTQMAEMLIKALAIEAIFALIFPSKAAGGAGTFLSGLFGAEGGTFQKGKKVASFASGVSMIVPGGYPRDSFPVMVTSGEKLKVTPVAAVGSEEKLLSEIVNRLDAMNKNIVLTGREPNIIINADTDIMRFTKEKINPSQATLNKENIKWQGTK